MLFSELCEKYFNSKDLYEILNIPKEATQSDVRRAYYKLSMTCHPDRVEEGQKEEASEKFKVLGKIHEIMSDENKRALYDNTGCYNEDDDSSTVFGDRDWTEYWRGLFRKVTKKDIEEYEVKYKDSEEELLDLKTAYKACKGDMDKILEFIPFVVTMDDEARIRRRIFDLIENEEIPKFDIFVNEPQAKRDRRHRKMKKEAKEAEKVAKTMEDLQQSILAKRVQDSDDFIANLEKKYGKTYSSGSKRRNGKKE